MIVLEWYGESGSLLSPLNLKFYYLNFINYFKIYIQENSLMINFMILINFIIFHLNMYDCISITSIHT